MSAKEECEGMSITEREAIEVLKQPCYCDYDLSATIENCDISSCDKREAARMAIKALEKQIEMKKYCDEQGCANCPYHNNFLNDNRCMNDFIIETE